MRVSLLLVAVLALGCSEGADAPARQRVVEVTAPRTSLGGVDMTMPLTDDTVAALAAHRDVAEVVPRMLVAVPARARAAIGGQAFEFEFGGLADGIDPRVLADDPELASRFVDGDGPVPVLISPSLIDYYDRRIAGVHGLPVLGGVSEHLLTRSAPRFTITLGETAVPGSAGARTGAAPRALEAQLVGVSAAAMPTGLSVPIEQVRRWNREYVGEEAATSYSSLTVTLKDERRLAAFDAWLAEQGLRAVE